MSSPDFFDDLGRHLDRAAHRQARYGRLAAAPLPSATAVLAAILVALVVGAGALALPRLTGSEDEVASPPTPRGPEAITVTPDVIRLGEGLVGVDIAKSGGRLYVLAGRHRTEQDLLFTPETAVLAAFDDAGKELWRTGLDRQPAEVQIVDGDPWVTLGGRRVYSPTPTQVLKIDASDGHVLDEVAIEGGYAFFEAFGSLWVTRRVPTDQGYRAGGIVRMDPEDLSTVRLDVPLFKGGCNFDTVETMEQAELGPQEGGCPREAKAGAGAIWVPLADDGVAMIDPDTDAVTVIGGEEIGHEVLEVAFDGDVAYVASSDQVTSIVGGEVVATTSLGEIPYLGPVDGAFGVVDAATRRLQVLRANEFGGSRRISLAGAPGAIFEVDGEAWEFFGRKYSFRRIEILP